MNEPTLIELNGKTYVRWNARVYTTDGSDHPYGVREPITDKCDVDALEKRYGAMQRQRAHTGPRPPIDIAPAHQQPALRSKGRVSNRESRGKGRVE